MSEQPATVLLVDDDPAVGKVLAALLTQDGIEARHALSGEEALRLLATLPIDVVVTDLRMPGMDGMQLLAELGKAYADVPVIMVTAHGNVPLAVEAMKAGAVDFVLKPFQRDEILYAVRKALVRAKHEAATPEAPGGSGFVGSSSAMSEAYALIRRAAAGTATVLLRGESGTGKELAARSIHDQSPRKAGPFVKIHCAALPDALLESELFGYEKGAFTGAANRKPGRVELAAGGTLFLDEIGDITPAMQVKLLRLLQDREFERLGSTQTLKVDVRFVTATHQPLEELVKKREFREDLFYRLNVVPIFLPPLRDRQGDLGPLATHFCKTLGAANGKPALTADPEALALLSAQSWPGNVRQLQNFIERLVVLTDGPTLSRADVARELSRTPGAATQSPAAAPEQPAGTLDGKRREVEKEAVKDALARAGNNRTLAARILGVSRRTLYNKLEEFGQL
jgi:two-component system response regulator AtoC